jgi:hypothetical protein
MDGLNAQHFDLLQDVERPLDIDRVVLRFAGDNRYLYYAFYKQTKDGRQMRIMIWDVETRRCMKRHIEKMVCPAVASSQGAELFTCNCSLRFRIWTTHSRL